MLEKNASREFLIILKVFDGQRRKIELEKKVVKEV